MIILQMLWADHEAVIATTGGLEPGLMTDFLEPGALQAIAERATSHGIQARFSIGISIPYIVCKILNLD